MKIDYDTYEDLDEMFSEMERNENQKRNKIRNAKQKKKNYNERNFQQPQGLPSDWREGDSFIGRQKKARNYNS